MRKIFSLLLIMAMLIIPANAESGTLLFDMDISASTEIKTVVSDKSGNGETVNLRGTPIFTKETVGTNEVASLSFNSATKNIVSNIRLEATNLLGLDETTVEMWIKPAAITEAAIERALFSVSRADKADDSLFYVSQKENKLLAGLNGTEKEIDITDYIGKWTYLTASRSYDTESGTAELKVYLNSKEVISESFAAAKEDESRKFFYIGAFGNKTADYCYRGNISEARIYNSAFSAADVKLNYLTQSQLYKIEEEEEDGGGEGGEEPPINPDNPEPPVEPEDPSDELSVSENGAIFDLEIGDTAADLKDISGNGFKVTPTGSPVIASFEGVEGKLNYVKFEKGSVNQYLVMKDSRFLNNPETSIEMRMQMPAVSSGEYPKFFSISVGGSSNQKSIWIEFGNDNGGFIALVNGAQGNIRINDMFGKAEPGEWVHVVMTRKWSELTKNTTMEIFFNGVSLGSHTWTNQETPGDNANAQIFAGGSQYNTAPRDTYGGGISEYRIYNKVLDGTEIAEKYESGLDRYKPKRFTLSGDEEIKRTATWASFVMLNETSPVSDITITDALSQNPFNAAIALTDTGFDVTFNQYLKYGKQLKLNSESLDAYIVAEVEKGDSSVSADIYDENDEAVTAPNGSDSYSVNLKIANAGSASKQYKYVVSARDESTAAITAESGTLTVGASTGGNKFFIMENTENAVEFRIYVWEIEDGMMIPLYNVPMIVK